MSKTERVLFVMLCLVLVAIIISLVFYVFGVDDTRTGWVRTLYGSCEGESPESCFVATTGGRVDVTTYIYDEAMVFGQECRYGSRLYNRYREVECR